MVECEPGFISVVDDGGGFKNCGSILIDSAAQIDYSEEFDIGEILRICGEGKYWILCAGLIAGITSIFMALQLLNIYRSDAVLTLSADSKPSVLAGVAGQLGGLASLAGMDLGGAGGIDKATLAIETLKFKAFLIDFIKHHEMTVPLMAAKGWNPERKEWIIDPDFYEADQKRLVDILNAAGNQESSDLDLYDAFGKMLHVDQDKKQIVTLAVESMSPELSQRWAGELVREVNEYLRRRDVELAERSIEYLKREIDATPVAQMQGFFIG